MYGHEGGWFSGGPFMWLIWIFIIIAVVMVIKAMTGGSSSRDQASPTEILKQRYAHGEIDEEEFERRRKELDR